MEISELISHAKRIMEKSSRFASVAYIEALEFLRIYAGEKSSFYKHLKNVDQNYSSGFLTDAVRANMQAFIDYFENGLSAGVTVIRQAQLDVVSDFLSQAYDLLQNPKVHPAAPTVIIGAALEEFLRNWIEEKDLMIEAKPCINTYADILRKEELLTKQDVKDITAWAGLRNHAAHGEWEQVEDKKRVAIMLEHVNLFISKNKDNAI